MAVSGRGFRIDIDGLTELGASLEQLAYPGLRNAIRASLRGAGGEAIASEMKQRAPRRTGGLVAGIGVHGDASAGDDVLVGYQGALSGGAVVNARTQLGAWVESGTRPHIIEAKDGGALSFNGGTFERVMHPGQRGQKIALKSMRSAEWEVMADIVDNLDQVAR